MFRSLATMVTAALSLPGCALQNKTEEFQTVPYFEVAADFETEPVLDPDDLSLIHISEPTRPY